MSTQGISPKPTNLPPPQIIRSGDLRYEYEEKRSACWKSKNTDEDACKLKAKVRINLPKGSNKNLPYMKGLVQRIVNDAHEHKREINTVRYIDVNTGRKWKLVKKSSTLRKLGRFFERKNISKFIHTVDSQAIEKYHLKRDWTLWDFFLEVRLFFSHKHEQKEYSLDFSKSLKKNNNQELTDPFTQLATRAYQELEHDYTGHDEGKTAGEFTSDYIMILDNNKLKLVHKKEAKKYKAEAEHALRACWLHYRKEYGKEKIDYAQHLAKFDFEKMADSFDGENIQALTPEHIYRLNILTSSVEHQDIQILGCKLARLNNRLKNEKDDLSLNRLFADLFKQGSMVWSEREERSLKCKLAKTNNKKIDDVTVEDLRNYINTLNLKTNFHTKLELTRTAILSVNSTEYSSLDELIDKHPDIINLWSADEKAHILKFTKAFTGKSTVKPNEFLKVHQHVQHLMLKAGQIKGKDLKNDLFEWLQEELGSINDSNKSNSVAAKCLSQLIKGHSATVNDFQKIFDLSSDMTKENYNELISLYKRDNSTLQRVYTGRKIQRTLDSKYTTADKIFYKPWVDMQEFLQACEDLEVDTVLDPYTHKQRKLTQEEKMKRFDEISVFMLCKKHLFRPHPYEGYRVGEIIPAPSDEFGNKRWYKVSRMVASHDGLLSYVLEPLGKNSGLQTSVVSRSTAGSNYAYESGATIKNDVNPIQDPGELGRRHTDRYLEPLRNAHTIPTWVAYQYAASEKLKSDDLNTTYDHLTRATEELAKEAHFKFHQKNMYEIVREFDAELNDLIGKKHGKRRWFNAIPYLKYTPLGLLQKIFQKATVDLDEFNKIIMRIAHDSSDQDIANENSQQRKKRISQERKDAKNILSYIKENAPRDKNGNLDSNYQDLVNIIGDNTFRNSNGKIPKKYQKFLDGHEYRVKRKGWIEKFNKAENETKAIINKCNLLAHEYSQNPTKESLTKWEKALSDFAIAKGEDVKSKQTNGLRYSGHSLGGSTAEIETYLATAGSNRLPVPGTTINASLYDDPGISEDKNLKQYAFILDHLSIMDTIESKVNVYHSLDYGDVVPLGATAHLGGITPKVTELIRTHANSITPKNNKKFEQWLKDRKTPHNMVSLETKEKFVKENLNNTFYTLTVLKNATPYALEAEICDYPVKHGTRYESARREQTAILQIANDVGKDKLKVDVDKNLGLLINYLKHIFTQEDGQFKKDYSGIYTDKVKCLEKTFDQDNVAQFLNLREKIDAGGRLTKDEEQKYNHFKKIGIVNVYNHTERMYQQAKIIKMLKLLDDVEAEKVVSDILKLMDKYEKDKSKVNKSILLNGYKNPLSIIKHIYEAQLREEAEKVRARAVGGVSITWIDVNELGEISGKGKNEDKHISRNFGFGIFQSCKVDEIRKYVGELLFPAFMQHLYDEKQRDQSMIYKGHGQALKYRNKKSKALVVDEFGGPVAGYPTHHE